MRKTMLLLPLAVLPFLFTACSTTTSITNLTPTVQPRSATGQYRVEMTMAHRQQTLLENSVTPYVVVGFDSYKMVRTPKMTNRWETVVPILPDKNSVVYYFKVIYDYQKFGKTGQESRLSSEYTLTIK